MATACTDLHSLNVWIWIPTTPSLIQPQKVRMLFTLFTLTTTYPPHFACFCVSLMAVFDRGVAHSDLAREDVPMVCMLS